jgi:hypothetical protein
MIEYKNGIALPLFREMPMPLPHRPKHLQPDLFTPLPQRPNWAALPPEIRAKVLPLLTRLLRTVQNRRRAANDKEVGHE